MPKLALTDRFVLNAKPKSGEPQTDYYDAHTIGLALRASAGGTKAWRFQFTNPADQTRASLSFATYPGTSLAAARTRADEFRGYLQENPPRDPRAVLAAQDASVVTVATLFDSWDEKRLAGLRSAESIRRRMRKDVLPVIGSTALAALHKRDVNRCIDPLVKRGSPIQANRVFEDLRAMLRWAVGRGDLDHCPMDGMSKPAEENTRERVLSDDEIRTIWHALPVAVAKSVEVQRITKLCLILGQRVGEVAGMRADELDLKRKLWSLPGARVKNNTAHVIPLPDMALSVIRDALKDAGEGADYLFPGDQEDGGSIRPRAVTRTLHRAQTATKDRPRGKFGIPEFTPHDLRRTVLTNMARMGVAPMTIGSVANHLSVTKASVTFISYIRHDYLPEKQAALDLWADHLQGIISGTGARVVPMSKGRRA